MSLFLRLQLNRAKCNPLFIDNVIAFLPDVGLYPTSLYCIRLIYIYLSLSENTDSITACYSLSNRDYYFLHIPLGF